MEARSLKRIYSAIESASPVSALEKASKGIKGSDRERRALLSEAAETARNVESGTLLRGCDAAWLAAYLSGGVSGYANFATTEGFAAGYGPVVCRFAFKPDAKVVTEGLDARKTDVATYDRELRKSKADGIRWRVDGLFHYRFKVSKLTLEEVIYPPARGSGFLADCAMSLCKANREASGLKQTEFAEAIGCDQATVSKIENGRIEPGFDGLIHMARYIPAPQTLRTRFGSITITGKKWERKS